MGRYEKLLDMLMDFNNSIRFAAISNTKGEILWHSKRNDVKLKVPLAETKKAMRREADDWADRSKFEDRNELGRAMYHITSFEKIKRITIPVDAFHLLFVSVDNEPLAKTKRKSYGRLVEMGKIMSIVDFVNTFEE
ncbi:hypothetical protein C6990_02500 [Nitrosopumilus sp. b3]|uniref:hypothetical protein n=1 Tax=Nitrosopumilus sp. b3 TaxID=2109909 RepID=UPI0015F588D2|nr:hypothetical protein [Nitrosopumilus sp. b3]KAF6247356.1 hypothetical protein C6990_02500 [Nitrosopumilus sp. b3]